MRGLIHCLSLRYTFNSSHEATMRITRNHDPLNVMVYQKFRLKTLRFSEWLEVQALALKTSSKSNDLLLPSLRAMFDWVITQAKKLGVPLPPKLAHFGKPIEDKKRKRIEILKEVMKGLSEYKSLESNIRCIQVKDIVKEVKDYLKTYSSAGMDISCFGSAHSFVPNFTCASLKEANALQKWKTSLKIPNNSQIVSTWTPLPTNTSSPTSCLSWFGITCNADGNINKLNLSTSELEGMLHQFLFSILHSLTYFKLSVNSFFGPVPPEIGLLSKLVYLDFSTNQFSRVIPLTIGKLSS
ncbi:leucine-rich repeat receptor-like protein kinase family protein [Tanacetum coccineum]